MASKMANAPVYLVVTQVKFNRINALDGYIPKIQDEFRKHGYPDFQRTKMNVLNLQMGGVLASIGGPLPEFEATNRYTFSTIQRDEGFILTQDGLTYLVAEYDVFETFVKKFMAGLHIVHNVLKLAYTERFGVRYLDAVFPDSGALLSKYLSGSVLGLDKGFDGGLIHSFSETKFKSGQIIVTARTVVQNSSVGLPPDLLPPLVGIANRFASKTGLHAILDTDASMEGRFAFSSESVESQFGAAHDEVSKVFREMTTDYAREAWK